jgi:oligopeptide/dipeptide ABC transporter ATP-binding protein
MSAPAGMEAPSTGGSAPLLAIDDLVTHFYVPDGVVRAVDAASFSIGRGEVLAVVGESGSGKSVTALSAMRLLAEPPSRTLRGQVRFHGEDLLTKSPREMGAIRGGKISMIFQNPYTALNPLIHIGDQLVETVRRHRGATGRQAVDIVAGLLERLGIKQPASTMRSFPFEVSMGASQRAMLASALLGPPELLIADEPTTMLDAIAQVEILQLIRELRQEIGMSVWLITHDFGVVAYMSDRVVVMYAGQPVETGTTGGVLDDPKHPYTVGLINSVPVPGARASRLTQIPGEIPDPKRLPPGCRFAPRCPQVMSICQAREPPMTELAEGGTARCWLYAK